MKPRIFVSSTFYDLKYIREDIALFIKSHDFEPIMFEDGDIGYTPGKNLDVSCYETMKNADMVILIIGGSYGSPASGEKEDAFKEYLSVTRKEFETAVGVGIPIYVFIESGVYAEYGIYDSNIKRIEEKKIEIAFKATKNINVFRFIKEIHSLGKIYVSEFRRPSEIKEFLSKQWSDMFKNYLTSLREEGNSKQLFEAVESLKSLLEQMGVMVEGLGKKIIGNETNIDYDKLLKEQNRIIAKKIAKTISDNFSFQAENLEEKERNVYIVLREIRNAINLIKKNGKTINFEQRPDEIFKFFSLEELQRNGINAQRFSLKIFQDWRNYDVICTNDETFQEVKEILINEFYNSSLFS